MLSKTIDLTVVVIKQPQKLNGWFKLHIDLIDQNSSRITRYLSYHQLFSLNMRPMHAPIFKTSAIWPSIAYRRHLNHLRPYSWCPLATHYGNHQFYSSFYYVINPLIWLRLVPLFNLLTKSFSHLPLFILFKVNKQVHTFLNYHQMAWSCSVYPVITLHFIIYILSADIRLTLRLS